MALLKKRIRASTLMESLVATVLIVIIFMVSSMLLNNVLTGKIRQNTELVEERLNALEYQFNNKGFDLPYFEDFESWEITISKEKKEDSSLVILEAQNATSNIIVTNYIIDGR